MLEIKESTSSAENPPQRLYSGGNVNETNLEPFEGNEIMNDPLSQSHFSGYGSSYGVPTVLLSPQGSSIGIFDKMEYCVNSPK